MPAEELKTVIKTLSVSMLWQLQSLVAKVIYERSYKVIDRLVLLRTVYMSLLQTL